MLSTMKASSRSEFALLFAGVTGGLHVLVVIVALLMYYAFDLDGGYLVYWLDWPITYALNRAGVLDVMSTALWITVYGIFGTILYAAPGALFGTLLGRVRGWH